MTHFLLLKVFRVSIALKAPKQTQHHLTLHHYLLYIITQLRVLKQLRCTVSYNIDEDLITDLAELKASQIVVLIIHYIIVQIVPQPRETRQLLSTSLFKEIRTFKTPLSDLLTVDLFNSLQQIQSLLSVVLIISVNLQHQFPLHILSILIELPRIVRKA